MKTIMIKLNSMVKVKGFVSIVSRYVGEFEVSEGRCTVDGKSIMGILSLDLKNNLCLNIRSEDNLPMLIHELEPYIIGSSYY